MRFVVDAQRRVLGHQKITSLSGVTSLTVPAGATHVVVQAEGQAVRWKAGPDGNSVAANDGQRIAVSTPDNVQSVLLPINPHELRFIEETAGATLQVVYLDA